MIVVNPGRYPLSVDASRRLKAAAAELEAAFGRPIYKLTLSPDYFAPKNAPVRLHGVSFRFVHEEDEGGLRDD